MKKKILLGLAVLFIVAQFFQPKKNVAPNGEEHYADIAKKYDIPADVQAVLIPACYDCHSENTRYPWYSKITPVNFWMKHHVDGGKKHFNFAAMDTTPLERLDHKLDELATEEITKRRMPLPSYLITHHDAWLNKEQKQLLIDWAINERAKLNTSEINYSE